MRFSPALLASARSNHGLVSVGQWTAAGHARSSFYASVRSGTLQQVAPGVAALPGVILGPIHPLAAAVLRFGPHVLLSHVSASWTWGADVSCRDRPVELITGADQRTTDASVVLHRPDDRGTLRPRFRFGLPVTAPLRTLLDVGATDPDAVVPTLEAMVRNGLLTVPAIRSGLERRRRRGRPGIVALERALRDLGGLVTDSELENRMRALLQRTGIDGWTLHEVVDGYEIDFCFVRQRVIVEVDGWMFHAARRDRWERDLERDAYLQARGWLIVHLSWRMVTRSPGRSADHLRRILRQR